MNRRDSLITILGSILFILLLVSIHYTAEGFNFDSYDSQQYTLDQLEQDFGEFTNGTITEVDLTTRLTKIISDMDLDSPSFVPTYNPTTPTTGAGHFGDIVPGTTTYRSFYKTEAFCLRVFNPSYRFQPQQIDIVTNEHRDVDCDRFVSHQNPLRILAMVTTLITDDRLRYLITRLTCAFYYRPVSNPTQPLCSSLCNDVKNLIQSFTNTRAQLQDRGIIEHYFWDNVLVNGMCNFSPDKFDPSNDSTKCMHGDDDTVFVPYTPKVIERARCVPYEAQFPNGGMCSNYVPNTYYDPLDHGRNQLALAGEILTPALKALIPIPCLSEVTERVCSLFYNTCTEVPVTIVDLSGDEYLVHLPVPVPSSRYACSMRRQQCVAAFGGVVSLIDESADINIPASSPAGAALSLLRTINCDEARSPFNAFFNCDNQIFASTSPYFSNMYFTRPDLVIAQADVPTYLFDPSSQPWKDIPLSFQPTVTCPDPLVPGAPGTAQNACAPPCPHILFTADDYKTITILSIILGTISNFCIIFLIISYFSFRKSSLGNHFLQFLGCVLCISISVSIGVYIRYDSTYNIAAQLCSSPSEIATQHDIPGCTAQAFFVHFAMLSLCAWWSITAFDLFLRIVLAVNIPRYSAASYLVSLIYWFWGWTIPLLLVSVAAALDSLGPADLSMFYCFVHGRSNGTVPWATAYIPLMIYLFIGCVSLTTTLYSLSRASKGPRMGPTLSLRNYIRPLLLEFALFVVFMYIVIFRAVSYFRENAWLESSREFIVCKVFSVPYSTLTGSELDCGLKPQDTPIFATWIILQCIICSCGTITFLVLGLNSDVYRLWCVLIGYYLGIERLMLVGEGTPEFDYYNHKMATQRKGFLAQEKKQFEQQLLQQRPSKSGTGTTTADGKQTGEVLVMSPPVITGMDAGSLSAPSSSSATATTTTTTTTTVGSSAVETKREGRHPHQASMVSLAKLAINNQLIIVKPYRKGKVIEYFTNIHEEELPRRRRRRGGIEDEEEDDYIDENIVDDDDYYK